MSRRRRRGKLVRQLRIGERLVGQQLDPRRRLPEPEPGVERLARREWLLDEADLELPQRRQHGARLGEVEAAVEVDPQLGCGPCRVAGSTQALGVDRPATVGRLELEHAEAAGGPLLHIRGDPGGVGDRDQRIAADLVGAQSSEPIREGNAQRPGFEIEESGFERRRGGR
jgi:hypothetical protein